MQVVIQQLELPTAYTTSQLNAAAAKRLGIDSAMVQMKQILRRSIDARPSRGGVRYIINAVFNIACKLRLEDLWQVEKYIEPIKFSPPANKMDTRPIVVGAGPAGLFAALTFALAGARPIIIERGKPLRDRQKDVGKFWGQGELNQESNVLYGEGGAGAFSDGKLTSRSKDKTRQDFVLKSLVDFGAPESVLYDTSAHLGSDGLAHIIPQLREFIIDLGGEFHFKSRLDKLIISEDRITGIIVNGEQVNARTIVLATGHSARDTARMLQETGVMMSPKDYAVGVRVELPQDVIDRSQYGDACSGLSAASFRLTNNGNGHTFCMCPGGRVISCASVEGEICTNGMSLSTRSGKWGNAAFLIPVNAAESVEAGIQELENIERKAFNAVNNKYNLPITLVKNFPAASTKLPNGSNQHTYTTDFTKFLPQTVCEKLKAAIPQMLKKLRGVDYKNAIVYGPETRSTSSWRILRGKNMQSQNVVGLFPAGEGAGFAGGIVSSAIDGIKAAEAALISCVES